MSPIEPTTNVDDEPANRRHTGGTPVAGLVFGGLTLAFFMALVFYPQTLHDPASRLPVIAVLSMGVALSSGFLGGSAAANGRIPLPGGITPVSFSVASGIGTFVIVFLIVSATTGVGDSDGAVRNVAPITPGAHRIRFAVWNSLSRRVDQQNKIALTEPYLAVVIYGEENFNVADIEVGTVFAADASVVPRGTLAAMYYPDFVKHPEAVYDENQDGFPDRKFDFKVPEMRGVDDLSAKTKYLRVWGRLHSSQQRFEGVEKVNVTE